MSTANQNLAQKTAASRNSILKEAAQGVMLMGHIHITKWVTAVSLPRWFQPQWYAHMVCAGQYCLEVLSGDCNTAGLQQHGAGLGLACPASKQDRGVPAQDCFSTITSVLPCSKITFSASPFYFNDLS